jgi:DNA repair protein SbcC/Rad50
MIKDVQMKDFIAHRDTKLEFCKGITIFVGHNGSGKSSVIDGVTYALFGKHTRKSNKNLIRRGANSAMVQMHFSLNSKEFEATRALGGSGTQSFSQFTLVSDAGKPVNKPLAGGERRQLGESMSGEIAKVLGLDYDKLRVAAVVQQGELVKIVEAQPREFKELLNSLIGIDRLDSAFETMREVITGFRDRLRDETGYTDEEIPRVEKIVVEKHQSLAQAKSLLVEFADEKHLLEDKMAQIELEIARLEPMTQKVQDLQNRERLIMRHVSEKRSVIDAEVSRLDRLVKEAKNSLLILKEKEEVQMRLQMVKAEVEDLQLAMQENEGQTGKLQGLLECSNRLKIVEGKCPVCNSAVAKVNEMFDTGHIQLEIKRRADEKSKLQQARIELKREEQQLMEQDKKIAAADKFLSSNSIKSADDVAKIEFDLDSKRKDLSKLPQQITRVDDPAKLAIDGVSKTLADEILALREQTRGFSPQQYNDAKLDRSKLMQKLQNANTKIGEHQKTVKDAQDAIDSASKVITQLQEAAAFVKNLDTIRSRIFNRDGIVGISLRSWALEVISKKASEYASLFNIGISRIELAEKAREIAITCYGRHGEIDMDSLSGGEKVAVALALRLGIAYMMGSNKLDFIILDEPTTHLDEERRKALVKIISEAFREGAGPLAQMIIITHDADIFENSEVDKVYQFAMTTEGSHVSSY